VGACGVACGAQPASTCPIDRAPNPVTVCCINFRLVNFIRILTHGSNVALKPGFAFYAIELSGIAQAGTMIDVSILTKLSHSFYDKISPIHRKNVING
jgi:hypothetical protein